MTKSQVYRTAVLTTLVYSTETWVLYRKQLSCWSGFTRDACNPSWASNGRTMSPTRRSWREQTPQALNPYRCSDMFDGKCDHGAPRKRFKDQLKQHLTQAGIEHSKWEHLSKGREEWRATIKSASDNFEEGRKTAAAEKRQRLKDSASQPSTDMTHVCSNCKIICKSRIGLHSHLKACRWASSASQ